MPVPKLYIFPISHYCEKARWALDYLQVGYELHGVAPGMHADLTAKLGAAGTSLPVLVTDDGVIQGSHEIIEWSEGVSYGERSLQPADLSVAAEMESRLNEVLGVHVRRMYYSEALVEHAETVLPIFADGLPAEEAQFVRDAWEVIAAAMVEKMDLGLEQGKESRRIVMEHLDWLDTLLSDGRHYLVGDVFSRVDLGAAALLAPLAMPPEHPTYGGLQLPPRLARDIHDWQTRPVTRYVADMYRLHRKV
ncbi:MAG: hypothetical protein Hals2KO_28320 [Halioglobus sp.]